MSAVLTTSTRPPAHPKTWELWSSEAFLDWLQPGVFADLVNGKILMHSPVSLRHANLVNFMDCLLRTFLDESDLGGVLHRETVAVRLSPRETFLPDLAYFTAAQAQRMGPSYVGFAPVWVMEALSPSAAKYDLGAKFTAYERYDVQEYWVLDPQGLNHRFFRRAGDMLEEFAMTGERILSSSIPGFWVKRSWLDPDQAPKIGVCVKELLRSTRRQ